MSTIRHAARTSFNLVMALVLAVSLGLTGGLAPTARAWADADAAAQGADADAAAAPEAANDTSEALNYFDDAAYQDFGLDISQTPTDFNSDTSDDPLAGFESYEPQNLYVSYMNRDNDHKNKGLFAVADSLDDLETSDLSLDGMLSNTYGGTSDIDASDWRFFQYDTSDACAVPYGDENLVAIDNLYTGTYMRQFNTDERVSSQEIRLERFTDGKTELLAKAYSTLGYWDHFQPMDGIDQNGSLGLTAMASGDFDGSGDAQLAVYVPELLFPRITIYKYDGTSELKKTQEIQLKDLGWNTFGYPDFEDWRMPILNLTTFPHDGYDDLVINACLPRTKSNGIGNADQNSVMRIFSRFSGGQTDAMREVFKYDPNFGSYRMRFVSALATDLNDNGVPELVMAGHYNSYSKNDPLGTMDSSTNLVQMITYDKNDKGDYKYQNVWDSPKKVDAISDIDVNNIMCEPAALASGKYLREQNNALFLEGYVFLLSSSSTAAGGEADLFKGGDFSEQFHMTDLSGSNIFIKKAVSGNFAKNAAGTEQLIVQAGTEGSGHNETVSYDVRWVYQEGKQVGTKLKQFDTDLEFLHNRTSHDDGTFLALCGVEANTNNAYKFKLKSKSYGWSAPEPIAVLGSVPYWGELVGTDDYNVGTTSFGLSMGTASGEGVNWRVGANFNLSVEAMFGVGFLGSGITAGGGFDFGLAGELMQNFYNEHEVTHELNYSENAGRDMVVCSATPTVVYEYEVWIPEFTANQEYCDLYNANVPNGGKTINVGDTMGGCNTTQKIVNTYDSVMNIMPLDEYNKAATRHASNDIQPLDKDQLFSHVSGDPTTYDQTKEQIPNVVQDDLMETSAFIPVQTRGGATLGASVTINDKSDKETGFDIAMNGGFSLGIAATTSLVVKMNANLQGGLDFSVGRSANHIDSKTKGQTFSTQLPQLPNDDAYKNYEHRVQMAVWRTKQANQPYVVGYLVDGIDASKAPKSLPRYPVAYSTSEDEIVWAWSNDTTRPVGKNGAYGIALPKSNGTGWTVPSDNVVGGQTNMFSTLGLSAGQSQSIRFQAYDDMNKTNPSAFGRELTGSTLSANAPKINTQPKGVSVPLGGTATFSVEAESQRGSKLDYKWYRLNMADSLYYDEWEEIPNETKSTLTISNVTQDDINTLYYVEVSDQTPEGLDVPTTSSKPVQIILDTQTTALSNDDVNAAPSGDDVSAPSSDDNATAAPSGADAPNALSSNDDANANATPSNNDTNAAPSGDGANAAPSSNDANVTPSNDNTSAADLVVPNIELLSFEQDDGTPASIHGDEIFLKDGTTGELKIQVTGSAGKDLPYPNGTLTAWVYYKAHPDDTELTRAQKHLGYGVVYDKNKSTATWKFDAADAEHWGGVGPTVYQIEISFGPDQQGEQFWTGASARFIINYGTVELDRKAHYLALDTDGVLPGLDEQDATSNDGAYKVAVTKNTKLPDLTPQMVGARFDGWYLDADFTTPLSFPFAPLTPGETTTLHGKWLQDEYNITYDLDGGTDPGNPAVLTNDSATVTLKDPTRLGYAFEGWYEVDDSGTVATEPTTYIPRGLTHDLELHAKWSIIEYPIYYSAFEGTNPKDNPHSYTVEDEVTIQAPLFEGAITGTNAWYADSLFSTKAATTIPKGSTGSVVLYGRADYPNPSPQPEPGPGPEVNPTKPAGGNGNGTALVSTGDATLPGIVTLASLLLLALVAAGTAAHRRRS